MISERRRILAWMGAAALAPLAPTPLLADDRPATPRMTEGPFYPRTFPRDTDADLTRIAGSTRVAEGRYAFRTIRPVPYPGRTPHIHFTVVENGKRRLTSQMFIEGEPGNERDGIYRSLGKEAALVTIRLENSGTRLKGALDVVLAA